MRLSWLILPILYLASLGLAGAAHAQQATAPSKPRPAREAPARQPAAQPAPESRTEPGTPPYEPQLLRLAEIMGSLSYLRDLCGDRDGAAFRARMNALMEAEANSETRRDRLAGAFNKGFQGFETIYRTCTPNAQEVITRYVEEGARIAQDVGNRFGGG